MYAIVTLLLVLECYICHCNSTTCVRVYAIVTLLLVLECYICLDKNNKMRAENCPEHKKRINIDFSFLSQFCATKVYTNHL